MRFINWERKGNFNSIQEFILFCVNKLLQFFLYLLSATSARNNRSGPRGNLHTLL